MIFFIVAYALLFGLCIGSFLNVCISRWPHEESVVRPRSRCPKCGHEITWYENIPVFSWLALRAKCSGCGEPISAIYPLVELAIGIIWALSAWKFGPTFEALRVAVFMTILAGIAITDLRYYLIPDGFTVTGLLWALGTAIVPFVIAAYSTEPRYLLWNDVLFAGPYDAFIGACTAAGLIAIVGWLGEVALKKEAMGMGDMTLMAFVGAALGPGRGIATIFLGATIGAFTFLLVVYPIAYLRRARKPKPAEGEVAEEFQLPLVPFGVFLAPAAAIMLLYGDSILSAIVQR